MIRRISLVCAVLGAFMLSGCPSEPVIPAVDGGPTTDTGPARDTGPVVDTGPRPDGGDSGVIPTDAPTAVCGNGTLEGTEACDDGNTADGDGCDMSCEIECGNGAVDTGETCDDANTATGDGCDDTCDVESGWTCDGADPTVCAATCGDGSVVGAEAGATGCDDGDTMAGDGCGATCSVETGYSCAGEPSMCMPGCGDGLVVGTEGCDDSDMTSGDGCSSACQPETGFTCTGAPSDCVSVCGDTIVASDEDCDDGGIANGDGCDMTCTLETGWNCSTGTCVAICGDSMTLGAETCDDGNTVTEACMYGLASCSVCAMDCSTQAGVASFCGNSATDAVEEVCDDGNTVTETACVYGTAACMGCDATCDTALTLTGNVCGDTVVAAGNETCDDGNTTPGDGCSATCQIEQVCGNSATEGTETCDDGNTVTEACAYGLMSCTVCNATCQNAAGATSFCGDRRTDAVAAETCDDGNATASDGCSATCRTEAGFGCVGMPSVCTPLCGNGMLDGTETCDDGNRVSTDGCSATCGTEPTYTCVGAPSVCTTACGNGALDGTEACDDGNRLNTDGCTATCVVNYGFACVGAPSVCTSTCGDGRVARNEACDDGNIVPADGCSATCTRELLSCGNGVVDLTETCDDGNAINGDGCTSTCRTSIGWNCAGAPSVCAAATADETVMGTGTPLAIPDSPAAAVTSRATATSTCAVGWVRPTLTFAPVHTYAGDLIIGLRSPSGTRVVISNRVGGGNDLAGPYTFTTGGPTWPGAGTPIASGTYNADMSAFVGAPAAGVWTLDIEDEAGVDTGTLASWSLEVGCLREVEPNQDLASATGGTGTVGNDFSSVRPYQTFSSDAIITADLTPIGDEDVFAIVNFGATPLTVRLETGAPTIGVCATADTGLRVRDGAGTTIVVDDDSAAGFCSLVAALVLPPGATYYVQVVEFGDNAAIAPYQLAIDFP